MRTLVVFSLMLTVGFFLPVDQCDAQPSGWSVIYQHQISNVATYLYDLSFSGSDTGTVVGWSGTIFRTTDGGLHWRSQWSNTGTTLKAVDFISSKLGVAVADAMVRTTDGGENWTPIEIGDLWLESVDLNDDGTGIAVGRMGTILKTDDFGISWSQRSSGTMMILKKIIFLNNLTGLIVGYDGTILRTTNGGDNWTTIPSGTSSNLMSVCFADSMHGVAVGYDATILRTVDGGLTWFKQTSSANSNLVLFDIALRDSLIGIAVGTSGTILRTSDGGNTWTNQQIDSTTFLHGVACIAPEIWAIVGQRTNLRSTDNGLTWASQEFVSETDWTAVAITGNGNEIVVGRYRFAFYTRDGWGSRHRCFGFGRASSNLSDLAFGDSLHGAVIGTDGTIWNSTDNGTDWLEQRHATGIPLNSIAFCDSRNGTVVGDLGSILRTKDGGATWSDQSSGTFTKLTGVATIDTLTAIAVGDSGTVLITSDGGMNWVSKASGTTVTLRSVSFSDGLNGLAVGDRGTVIKTSDGGHNWTLLNLWTSCALFDISYIDSNTATAVGDSGIIIRSTDGGMSWSLQSNPEIVPSNLSYSRLNSVSFADPDHGTIVGDNDVILRTTTGGVTWIEEPKSTPTLFHLAQNYPNPVTTSTTIPFTIKKPEHVTLSVYNMLGREVAVLVGEEREMGFHSIPFDASGLASGMYFYVLRTGSAVQTRKMLVVNQNIGF